MSGESLVLCYDWEAIGKLVTELGKDFDSKISAASIDFDLPVLAIALSIGLEKHQPGRFPPKAIMHLSPPVIHMIAGIQQAITVAFHGSLEVPGDQESNPPQILLKFLKRILWDWWGKPSKG